MNIHLGRKPFQCAVCFKAFSNKSNLLQHRRLHSNQERLRCPMCYKSYSDPNIFKVHLKNKHNRDVEVKNIKGDEEIELSSNEPDKTEAIDQIQVMLNFYEFK